jgi:hypothetical protein
LSNVTTNKALAKLLVSMEDALMLPKMQQKLIPCRYLQIFFVHNFVQITIHIHVHLPLKANEVGRYSWQLEINALYDEQGDDKFHNLS